MPTISVVTPSFNQAKFLPKTIESVHSQKGDFEIEHWVIDGGSTDGTVELLKKHPSRLKWISEKDRGQSDALNKGFRRSSGPIIGWINSDDTYEPGAFQKVLNYFGQHPDVHWVTGKCQMIDEHGQEIRKLATCYKNFCLKHYSYTFLLIDNFISQPATFFRKELVEDLGGIDETYDFSMDYEYWLRIGSLGYIPGIIHDHLANFRIHSSSKMGGFTEKTFRMAYEINKKYTKRRPLIRFLNYLFHYKRTVLLYKILYPRLTSKNELHF